MSMLQHIKDVALLLILLITPCLAGAQKKELSQARTYLKSGKDFDKAERLMTDLLKTNPESRSNKKVFLTWFEAVHKQYEAANERFYLKQQQDTAAFFDLTHRMFVVLEALDSLDARPDKKGHVEPEYRTKHAALLAPYRRNLYNGGIFFVRKAQWQQALRYFETYIDCDRQPLFTGYNFAESDPLMAEAAYWACYSGYKQQDPVVTLRHRSIALRDTSKAQFTLMYVAEARRWLNDGELYLETLEEGFRRYPTFYYFFPRLMDEYNRQGAYDKALAVADSALAADSTSQFFLFAKSSVLLRMERYEPCIACCNRLLALNDTMADAHCNAGTAYLNMAMQLDQRKQKKQVKALYQKARTHVERFRALAPDERERWAPLLYRIYLNLNMGRQFDEIDSLLK